MSIIPKGTKLHCEHCGEVLNEIIKDLPDNELIRKTDEYLKYEIKGLGSQRAPGIMQRCIPCDKESDLYRLILEVLHAGGL